MEYEDLSIYEYSAEVDFPYVYRVGWLNSVPDYPTAPVDASILQKFEVLINRRQPCDVFTNKDRRALYCEICDDFEQFLEGGYVNLESAELWIPSNDGRTFVAPSLVYHYIRDHLYAPPFEFTKALLTLDPTLEYSADQVFEAYQKEYAPNEYKEDIDLPEDLLGDLPP